MVLPQNTHYAIHFYSLLAFAFLLPIYPYAAVLSLNITALNWLLSGEWTVKCARMKHPFVISSVLFFAWHLIGMAWTEDQLVGSLNLETKLSFLVMPLVVYTSNGLSPHCRKKLLLGFVCGVIASVLVALSLAGYNAITEGSHALFYTKLSETIGQHPTYMGLYIGFSFLCLLYFFRQNGDRFKRKGRLLFLFVLAILYLTIFLLSARIIILAFTFVLGIATFSYYWRKEQRVKGFLFTIIILFANAIITFSLPTTSKRMSSSLQQNISSENIRIFIWTKAFHIAKTKPTIGVGTGDIQPFLNQYYQENGAQKALEQELDVHNQYLQTAGSLGLIGLLLLLFMLGTTFFYTFQHNHVIALFMISMVAITLLTESGFERQWGILFYCFFASLFMMDFIPNQSKDECKVISINRNRKARPL